MSLGRASRVSSAFWVERRTRSSRGAFTLVELMVVVAIVGVLAVLAGVGYRKMVDSSHVTEASHMVQAIRVAQESYRAEVGRYADISSTTLCPQNSPVATPPSKIKTAWNTACPSSGTTWARLPVHTDGPVEFGLMLVLALDSVLAGLDRPGGVVRSGHEGI